MIRLKYNIFEIIRYTFTFHDFKSELPGGEGGDLIERGEFLFQKGGLVRRELQREGRAS